MAGQINQAANSIILNATGGILDQTTANTFTVKPVRQGETADAMYYNSSTGEITYAGAFSFSVAADDSTQRAISNNELIKFIGAGGITTASDAEGYITITQGTTSQLVNGTEVMSLAANGEITCPSGLNIATGQTYKIAGYNVLSTGSILNDASQTSVTIAGSATTALNIGASGAPITGFAATATTASTAASLGYLGLPQSATSTTATLAIGDVGKHIYVTTNSQTITIPANASVAYPIGTTLTFIAGPSPVVTVTIAITSDTLRLAGGTSTGSRTLAANGMATAVKVAATTWYINGTGLT
jgi:hypothetical protein